MANGRGRRAALACGTALAVMGAALPAWANRPFDDCDLFSGHSLRQSSKDRKIAAGLNLSVAPVPYVAKKALNATAEQVSKQYPDAKQIMTVLQHVDTGKARDLAKTGQVEALKAQLKAESPKNGHTLTADETKAVDAIDSKNISAVADIIDVVGSPGNALVFGLEPWFEYNFGTYDLVAYLPLAGFRSDDGTSFELGNLNLDFRAGSRKGYTAAIGWTGGLSLYLPTGTEKSNQVALSNIIVAPKYLHEYLTIQPYGIFGVELAIVSIMARLEYTHMQAMRGNPIFSSVDYLNWGASTVIHLWVLDLVAELDGLVNVNNAPAMQDILATAGLRGVLGAFRGGLAVRMPITKQSSALYAESLGTGFSNIARVNVLLQGILSF